MYKFRNGFPAPKNLDAEKAFLELERIRAKNGGLVNEQIIEESRPKKAVLHCAFEWDDSIAAHKYRLNQAGNLVRGIIKIEESEERHVYANVVVIENDRREYVPVKVLEERTDLFEDAKRKALVSVNAAIAWLEELEAIEIKRGDKPSKKTATARRCLERARKAIA